MPSTQLKVKNFVCACLIFIPLLYVVAVYAQTYPNAPTDVRVVTPVTLPWSIEWTESDGTVTIPPEALRWFGQTQAHYQIEWTPGLLHTTGASQRLLDIPNHLGVWIWNDGVHGEWFSSTDERRLFRTRWGLPKVGTPIKIVVSWNSAGYAVIVDDILRIHDWQTKPLEPFPDPDIVNGVIGSRIDGSRPASGSFRLTVFDPAVSYDPCSVDVVGTINEGVPLDNTGSWSQGIDPACP